MIRYNCTSIDELNILLALNGNQRLPHLEEEIFANKALSSVYLHNLCRNQHWYDKCLIHTTQAQAAPTLAYYYSYFILCDRWSAAEPYIAHYPRVYANYRFQFQI